MEVTLVGGCVEYGNELERVRERCATVWNGDLQLHSPYFRDKDVDIFKTVKLLYTHYNLVNRKK